MDLSLKNNIFEPGLNVTVNPDSYNLTAHSYGPNDATC